MSTHIVNKLQNGGTINIPIHLHETMCLEVVRLKMMKVGNPNGSFALTLSNGDQVATSIVTTLDMAEYITANFNGYISFVFDDILINVNKGSNLTIQASLKTDDYDGDDENFVALVYELTKNYEPYYGIELYSIG